MANFDFISGEDFRKSLENDYQELNCAMEVKAWKAVHVLAGSIIEALLADYLVSINYQQQAKSKDPLNMSLDELITACTQQKILSTRTEQISHAIRSYRNLIHPGRVIRLNESVDEENANVAQALVNIIINEVTKKRKENYGYTAEQIATKIEHDTSTVAILGHLLSETNDFEKERLLLEVIPKRYMYNSALENAEKILDSLAACFRLAYNNAAETIKKKVEKSLVKVIKEESEDIAYIYEVTFFRAEDLQFYSPENARLVINHLLFITSKKINNNLLVALKGIGLYLETEGVENIMKSLFKELVRTSNETLSEAIKLLLQDIYFNSITGYDELNGFIRDIKDNESKHNKCFVELIEGFEVELFDW